MNFHSDKTTISRRDVLRAGVYAGLALGSAGVWAACSGEHGMAAIPPAVIGKESGLPLTLPPVLQEPVLRAETGIIRIAGIESPVWTLGGSYPSPTIKVMQGQQFSLNLINALSVETNLHWHGLQVPPGMDGHPKDAVPPGGQFRYTFPVLDRAGTYWYHPHPHKLTARQAYMGMAGLFIIEDPREKTLGLPTGEYDVPLVLQDRRFSHVQRLVYAPSMNDMMTGYLGDTMFVNGLPVPYHEIENGLYRFRLLNASTARVLRLEFDTKLTMHVIASDGGLLASPIATTQLWLAPGERVEVLVDFSTIPVGASALLRTAKFEFATPQQPGASLHGGISSFEQGWEMPVLRFNITRKSQRSSVVPPQLAPLSDFGIDAARTTRIFTLNMQMTGETGGGQYGSSTAMMPHTINDKLFAMNRIDEQIPFDTVEQWEFQNKGDEPHPMHVHGAQFQVVWRSGGALLPSDAGWKDTVLVFPAETVRVVVRFAHYRGLYLLHCHNLEHEDDGMMANINIL